MCSKILEIHADNKDVALDLGKEFLKLVAADPDTVEAKFPEDNIVDSTKINFQNTHLRLFIDT